MSVQAGVVQKFNRTHTQISALISSSQSASGALQAAQSGNQIMGLANAAARRFHRRHRRDCARAKPRRRGRLANQAQGQQQLTNFLNYGRGYQPGSAQMFH